MCDGKLPMRHTRGRGPQQTSAQAGCQAGTEDDEEDGGYFSMLSQLTLTVKN